MSNSTQTAEMVRQFALELKHVRREAGEMSMREMAKHTNHSASTLNRAIGGVRFPRWEVVERYLLVCRVAPAQIAEHWRPRWVVIANALRPLEQLDTTVQSIRPALTSMVDTYMVCGICGAVVADPELHSKWHKQFVPRIHSVAG